MMLRRMISMGDQRVEGKVFFDHVCFVLKCCLDSPWRARKGQPISEFSKKAHTFDRVSQPWAQLKSKPVGQLSHFFQMSFFSISHAYLLPEGDELWWKWMLRDLLPIWNPGMVRLKHCGTCCMHTWPGYHWKPNKIGNQYFQVVFSFDALAFESKLVNCQGSVTKSCREHKHIPSKFPKVPVPPLPLFSCFPASWWTREMNETLGFARFLHP